MLTISRTEKWLISLCEMQRPPAKCVFENEFLRIVCKKRGNQVVVCLLVERKNSVGDFTVTTVFVRIEGCSSSVVFKVFAST